MVFMEIGGPWVCLGGNWVLSPCSMGPKHYFATTLKGTTFFHLTILRHQNTKTAAYQLSKNDWVRPFIGVFRFTRDKSFVTVAFGHPVVLICETNKNLYIFKYLLHLSLTFFSHTFIFLESCS